MCCIRRAALVAGLLGLVAGCHLVPSGGMADRCADIMQQAYPGVDIDITKREAAATSITTIVAHVEGVRSDMPPMGRCRAIWRWNAGLTTAF